MRRVISESFRTPEKIFLAILLPALCLALAMISRESVLSRDSSTTQTQPEPLFSSSASESVYAADRDDSWNRIFRLLFTRRVTVRLSDEFSEGAPFVSHEGGMMRFRVSTRTFQRFEEGDRSIDPLYPSFFNDAGIRKILSDPDFSDLKTALNEAINETTSRTPLGRALMQGDVWAAHDILFVKKFSGPKYKLPAKRREELLSLMARFIRKLALAPDDLRSLPDNYLMASRDNNLPDLFTANGPWLEIRMSPHRLHDSSADYRRAARVFVQPVDSGMDKMKFLERLRTENHTLLVNSVALITQNNLIDTTGTVQPTRLTSEVQVRTFIRDQHGKIIRTELRQYELSRRALLSNPSLGGFIEIPTEGRLYFPAAGNDYRFASPQSNNRGNDSPVLVTLRRRCEGCHGLGATTIFTFSSHLPPPLPPIALLTPPDNVHGWYIAGRKQESEDFKALWQLMIRN